MSKDMFLAFNLDFLSTLLNCFPNNTRSSDTPYEFTSNLSFESAINERSEKKKSIAFAYSIEDSEDRGHVNSEGVPEDLVLMGR